MSLRLEEVTGAVKETETESAAEENVVQKVLCPRNRGLAESKETEGPPQLDSAGCLILLWSPGF